MIRLHAPTSKSLSHRTLIAAALAPGESVVRNVLNCDDTKKTRAILESAGAKIEAIQTNDISGDWKIIGMQNGPLGSAEKENPTLCDVGESGTSCRLLTAILAGGKGYFKLYGVERMHERPIGALVKSLREMGAVVEMEKDGYPPLLIGDGLNSKNLNGQNIEIALDESSQYLSGLLLMAPFCDEDVSYLPVGKKIVSFPYVALTLQIMESFGIECSIETLDGTLIDDWKERSEISPNEVRIKVKKGTYKSGEHTVEGDWSGASYLLAAGAIGKEAVEVVGLDINSSQGDKALLDILKQMGAKVEATQESVIVTPSKLTGITVDMNACPDIVPTVAVLAACAEGVTRITNVPHLRVKECDRLSAVASELIRVGIDVEELEDGIIIQGKGKFPTLPPHTLFQTYNDHRLAMSMSLFGLHGASIDFDDKKVVKKSFPTFWEVMSKLGE